MGKEIFRRKALKMHKLCLNSIQIGFPSKIKWRVVKKFYWGETFCTPASKRTKIGGSYLTIFHEAN